MSFIIFVMFCTFVIISLCRTPKLREQAVELVRDLLASHDADPRYQSKKSRERIAMLYMPLLSVVMDNLANLYHGGDGWDDWAMGFER